MSIGSNAVLGVWTQLKVWL